MRNMKDYIIAEDSKLDTLTKIHKDFLDEFKINLNSEKYKDAAQKGIEFQWSIIINDCFGKSCSFENLWMLPDDLTQSVQQIMTDGLVGAEEEVRDNTAYYTIMKKKIEKMLKTLMKAPYMYCLYDNAAWMDALLATKYVDNKVQIMDYDRANTIYEAMPQLRSKKDEKIEDQIILSPFDVNDLQSGFCKELKSRMTNKYKRNLFNAKIIIEKYRKEAEEKGIPFEYWRMPNLNFCMELELEYAKGSECDLSRWSFESMEDMEKTEGFTIEDRILFYKITDTLLIRYMVDEIDSVNAKLSEYRLLFGKLKTIDSLPWQIFLTKLYTHIYSCLHMMNDVGKMDLEILEGLYSVVRCLLDSDIIEHINRVQKLLSSGLFYVYYNNSQTTELEKIENKVSADLEFWKSSDNALREKIENHNNSWRTGRSNNGVGWDYVFLQMENFGLFDDVSVLKSKNLISCGFKPIT